MASISQVRLALAQLIEATVFPSGPTNRPLITVPGVIKIVPDWPAPGDVSTQKIGVPPGGSGNVVIAVADTAIRNITQYPNLEFKVVSGQQTLFWSAGTGLTATLSGTVSPQNLALVIDKEKFQGGIDVTYAVLSTDTLQSITDAIANKIPAPYTATLSGNTITINGAHTVDWRVGTLSTYVKLTAQQKATMCVAIFCALDDTRNQFVNLLKPTLDLTSRMTLSDYTIATIVGAGTEVTIRDMTGMGVESSRLVYTVDFSSALTEIVPQAIVIRTTISNAGGVIVTKEA